MSALLTTLVVLLAAYSLGHYTCVLVFAGTRLRPGPPPSLDHGDVEPPPVTVLIPARNEGERALRAIASVMAQDHRGKITVVLLVKDRTDSAVPLLLSRFEATDLGERIVLTTSPNRTAIIALCGVDPKSEKINRYLDNIDTQWVGILDCDHQAHPAWIRTSLARVGNARIVQSRRAPLSAKGFFALWDSLHQHIGCELFNVAFTRLGLPVFFTGTTTLIDTSLLREHRLSGSITEDIELSYRTLMLGIRPVHNPIAGSDEENSPDLYSFLARRRRWANGHTDAFFRHAHSLGALSGPERLQFLLHGAHYLVAVVVFTLHLLIGAWFWTALPAASGALAALVGLVLGATISSNQRTIGWRRGVEIAVLFAWLTPALVIAMNATQALLAGDATRAALPVPGFVQILGLIGFSAPPILLLAGLFGFRQLGVGALLAVVFTWPLAFYLDLCGVLLGMVDLVVGRATWRPIHRDEPTIGGDAGALRTAIDLRRSWSLRATASTLLRGARTAMKPRHWISAAALGALFCAGALYAPAPKIAVEPAACTVLEHDGDPWIVPARDLPDYCGPDSTRAERVTRRTGSFERTRTDTLTTVDPSYWDRLDTTFFCNESTFSPDNVVVGDGVQLRVDAAPSGGKAYTSGSIATVSEDHLFGRYEVTLKPARGSGLLTAFFLYRFDPWQEIDAEFLGKDPTKMLINVYYNPGKPGDLYNYGFRGTPVLVDLGFDASEDYHRYAIEWEAGEIRWFVDDRLIHVRRDGAPTPIPHLPMRFHVNVWPICSEDLAGPIDPSIFPVSTGVHAVTIDKWHPSPFAGLMDWFEGVLTGGDWRRGAGWMR
jgi:cellulose synthase/poly-beta-1,6-N-acetylglucosamine synthase-like glycosyltransferase